MSCIIRSERGFSSRVGRMMHQPQHYPRCRIELHAQTRKPSNPLYKSGPKIIEWKRKIARGKGRAFQSALQLN